MANKQRFLFTSNSLSKGGYLKAYWANVFLQSKNNARKTKELLSNIFGTEKAQVYLFGAGRMGVYTLIKSLRLTEQDEVIVAGYTCVVLTNAVKFTGCKVRYIDIDKANLNIDTAALIAQINPASKLLIVPHNFGIPYHDIPQIKEQFPELIILEDAAHTFGSKSGDKLCGTIADAGFFSLEYSKPITAGLGGIMLINNENLQPAFEAEYQQLEEMSSSMVRKLVATLGTYNLNYFRNTTFFYRAGLKMLRLFKLHYVTSAKEINGELPDNYPVKMHPKLTSFLLPQLRNIERINNTKKDIAQQYQKAFKSYENIEEIEGLDQVLVRYPIVFKSTISVKTIENLKKEGISLGLNFGVWFNDVVHPVGSFRYCYTDGSCPEGEKIAKRIINLPININYPSMLREIEDIKALFKKYGIN